MLALACMTLGAFAFGQDLADGDGKDVVAMKCTTCHDASNIVIAKKSKDEWVETLGKMTSYGAAFSEKEFVTIIDYLTNHYGKGGAPAQAGASDPAAKKAADEAALPAGDGREYVAVACQACHDLENVKLQKLDKDGWTQVINGMVTYGAKLTPDNIKTASEYLAKAFPK